MHASVNGQSSLLMQLTVHGKVQKRQCLEKEQFVQYMKIEQKNNRVDLLLYKLDLMYIFILVSLVTYYSYKITILINYII